MKMRLVSILLMTVLTTMPVSAGPSDWSSDGVHVTYIEMKVGNAFRFMVDQQAGPCAPNTMLIFDARFFDPTVQADMVKTVYATVLATKLSDQKLHITGDNTPGPGGVCVVGIVDSH
jgi:hypothetical protein